MVKNGYLVAERYYGDTEATDANTVMSVSKSFLSALVGIAVEEGYLSLSERVMDYFPEYVTGDLDPRKLEITVRHLLTMTGGLPYDNHGDHWDRWMQSSDWVGFCLAEPLESDPGTEMHYSTCSTHVMSALLTRAIGMSTREFSETHLLDPLGITLGGWRRDPQGYDRGGWDMHFTPRDMARFGELYLGKGKLDRQRIVPRKWVKRTTRPFVRGGAWGPFQELGYGYWWWTARGSNIDKTYLAWGYGGQHIIVVPREKLVIVTSSDANVGWSVADEQEGEVVELVASYLLEPISAMASR